METTLRERLGDGTPPYWLLNWLRDFYKIVEEERNREIIVDLIDEVTREWALPKVVLLDVDDPASS